MVLTKQYLRYVPSGVLNFLASHRSNIATILGEAEGKGRQRTRAPWVCFACGEIIYIWDARKNEKVLEFSSVKAEVTCLKFLSNEKLLAAGYADGSVAVYNLLTEDLVFSQKAHRSSVTCVAFDAEGSYLASGSNDTETILWDVVGQTSVCRFKGHKSPVTDCHFMQQHPYLVTCSKDSLVKVWDLQTLRCCSTLVGHKSEICRFAIFRRDARLITGSADAEIRVYDLTFVDTLSLPVEHAPLSQNEENIVGDDVVDSEETSPVKWKLVGSIVRQGKARIVSLVLDSTDSYLCFHGNDRWLEIVKINSDEKVKELLDRRIKKRRKKAKREVGEDTTETNDAEADSEPSTLEVFEAQFAKLPPVRCSGKIGSVTFLKKSGDVPSLLVSLGNSLVTYTVDIASNALTQGSVQALPAHLTDIRTGAITSDGNTIITTCSDSLRIWDRESSQCVHTLPCDYGVSSALIPGDRYLVVGSKSGKLQLYDIMEGILDESIQAHEGPVWSVCLSHESRKSLVTGSEDKEVKFWDLDFGRSDSDRKMTLTCTKSLKMDNGITVVKLSPDQRLLAVALLDFTVKVFFVDTLKFFLSLYGSHSMPVTAMDISSDSRLIATGAADKSVKIWGLDFGDCHKSLFAHDESVSGVVFIPKTHLFFSSGRDGKIKQWDADKFERITTLSGHHSAIWSLSISSDGRSLLSTSHDRSIRLWEKSDEIVVLEEEREVEREADYDRERIADDDKHGNDEPVIPGESNKEIGVAGKKSLHAIQAADKIIEALDIVREESAKKEAKVKDQSHPILLAFGGISAEKYVLEVIKRIKPSELHGALIALALNEAVELVRVLENLLAENSQTELLVKCLTYLLKINALQVESHRLLLPELDELRSKGTEYVDGLRNLVGFNRAALEHLQQQIEEREEGKLFADATQQFSEKKKKQKRRAVIAMSS